MALSLRIKKSNGGSATKKQTKNQKTQTVDGTVTRHDNKQSTLSRVFSVSMASERTPEDNAILHDSPRNQHHNSLGYNNDAYSQNTYV